MRRYSGIEIGSLLVPLVVAAPLVAIDRVTKNVVVQAIGPDAARHRIDIIGNWAALEYAENRGAAFGLFGAQAWLLPLVATAIVAAIAVAFIRQPRPPLAIGVAAGLAIGGAIGNLIDRVRLGHVVDFIAVGSGSGNATVTTCPGVILNFGLRAKPSTNTAPSAIKSWTKVRLRSGKQFAT
jgi:signal peptidase II